MLVFGVLIFSIATRYHYRASLNIGSPSHFMLQRLNISLGHQRHEDGRCFRAHHRSFDIPSVCAWPLTSHVGFISAILVRTCITFGSKIILSSLMPYQPTPAASWHMHSSPMHPLSPPGVQRLCSPAPRLRTPEVRARHAPSPAVQFQPTTWWVRPLKHARDRGP